MKSKKIRKKNKVGGSNLNEASIKRFNNIMVKTAEILNIIAKKTSENKKRIKIESIQHEGRLIFNKEEATKINILGRQIINKYNKLKQQSGSGSNNIQTQIGGFSDFFIDKEKIIFQGWGKTIADFISKTLKGSTKCNKELLTPIDMILWFLGSLWFIGGPADFAAFIKSILFGNIKSAIILFLNRLLFFQDPALKIFYLGHGWVNSDYLNYIENQNKKTDSESNLDSESESKNKT